MPRPRPRPPSRNLTPNAKRPCWSKLGKQSRCHTKWATMRAAACASCRGTRPSISRMKGSGNSLFSASAARTGTAPAAGRSISRPAMKRAASRHTAQRPRPRSPRKPRPPPRARPARARRPPPRARPREYEQEAPQEEGQEKQVAESRALPQGLQQHEEAGALLQEEAVTGSTHTLCSLFFVYPRHPKLFELLLLCSGRCPLDC